MRGCLVVPLSVAAAAMVSACIGARPGVPTDTVSPLSLLPPLAAPREVLESETAPALRPARSTPPVTAIAMENAVAELALHYERSCARLAGGKVKCWGLVFGDPDDRPEPVPKLVPALGDVARLALGANHACAIVRSGRLRCWGSNEEGALGDGSAKDAPGLVDPGLEGVADVEVGSHSTCARTSTQHGGDVLCWGSNRLGSLANGSTAPQLRPKPSPALAKSLQIALAGYHGFALVADGTVRVWGDTPLLPPGMISAPPRPLPVLVFGISKVIEVAASPSHACARLSDGQVACWGKNENGQLGDGTTVAHELPNRIVGVQGAAQVSVGPAMSCARLANGSVKCWGANEEGQLGDGTTIERLTPTTVPGLTGVKQIAVGGSHACALLGDGSVQCWGSNRAGELGDGTLTSRGVRGPVLW